jgi:hypothetical protein
MSLKTLVPTSLALLAGSATCFGQSAWLPAPKQFKVTPGFSFSTFDEFWAGDKKVSNPPNGDSLNQYTGYIALEYGILQNFAADATIGYTATSTDAFGGNASDDGLMDTSLGLRYRLVDEFNSSHPWAPTVTLRAGVVIPGTYDENAPFSAGDGAHAFEGSLLLGKAIGATGFGLYGDIGYRVRENPVPDDVFGTAGVYQQIGPVTLAVGYRHIQSVSGIDIGGSDFNPALGASHGFPAVKEINQLVEGGITFTDKGGRNYQFSVAKSVDGRNTGDKWVFGFNVTLPFGGH